MDFISSEDKGCDAKNKTHFAVVMEYIPHTLEDVMRKGVLSSKQGPEVIKEIMRQLFSGLEFLHRSSIIHRDIKPSNILVSMRKPSMNTCPYESEPILTLKLIDFSISKVLTDHNVEVLNDLFTRGIFDMDSNRLTRNVTTRPYRAPEVALITPYDSKIDLWAAGCILAELLMSSRTGKRELLFQAHTC